MALTLPVLAACSSTRPQNAVVAESAAANVIAEAPEDGDLNGLIAYYSQEYQVPEDLVHHVVNRESTYNPEARNGPYWGLMQIHPQTARTMGYDGRPEGLLDARTNLTYAVKYLAGAYRVAHGDHALADRYYRTGYYYEAKRQGLLEELGLR